MCVQLKNTDSSRIRGEHTEQHTAYHLRHVQHVHRLQHVQQQNPPSTGSSSTRRINSGTSSNQSPNSTASSIQNSTQRITSGTSSISDASSTSKQTEPTLHSLHNTE